VRNRAPARDRAHPKMATDNTRYATPHTPDWNGRALSRAAHQNGYNLYLTGPTEMPVQP
jgi:hypothetical protein